jgi:hypothetical protein
MKFLGMCRPIFRLGVAVFWLGKLLTVIGLVLRLLGKGWTVFVIGIGCVAFGIIGSQIPVIYVGNKLKAIDESLTPKQVSDLASKHLRQHGEDADETAVFLGRFGGEFDVVKKHRRAAERGDAEGQYRLGFDYQEGFGVRQDEAEAVKWYRKAAAQNYAQAQYNLGECYRNGRGVAKDEAEAGKWAQKALENGYIPPTGNQER